MLESTRKKSYISCAGYRTYIYDDQGLMIRGYKKPPSNLRT